MQLEDDETSSDEFSKFSAVNSFCKSKYLKSEELMFISPEKLEIWTVHLKLN